MSKSTRDGIEPTDLFSEKMNSMFGDVELSPTSSLEKTTTPSITEPISFDPSNKFYEYIDHPSPYMTGDEVQRISAEKQPWYSQLYRGTKVASANLLSSFGQTLASTFDLINGYHTAKSLFNSNANDDFNSSLFGIVNTKQMADWAKGVQERNQIFEKNPGTTSPGDFGWWTNEILPQMGTLTGTALSALGTTVAIEGLTGGEGTAVAAANLYNSVKKFWGAAKAGEIIEGGLDLAKGMKGAAAMYAAISRYSEARFEAQNNYQNTYDKLSNTLKPDGTPYTEDEKKHYASEGAKVDFGLTLSQLPLDILAMRAMIFNPLTGTAEGGLERGLQHIAEGIGTKTALQKSAGWLAIKGIGATAEGIVSGAIPIFQAEGEHHAMVLAGLDDNKSSWTDRLGKELGSSEFSTMVASGILGSLIIGPAMNTTKNIINKNKLQAFNDKYKNYVNNVAPTLSSLANTISEADANGDTKTAQMGRRRFNADRAIDALHLDTMAGKSDMFNAHMNFLNSTLNQANNIDPNTNTNISDLFGKATPEQIDQVKKEFQSYINDANTIKQLYNQVGQRYNRNLVPIITNQHFSLQELLNENNNVDTNISSELAKISQYNLLTPQGKQLHDYQYQVRALNHEKNRLTDQLATVSNEFERANVTNILQQTKDKLENITNRIKEINSDENYTKDMKETDTDIINSSAYSRDLQQSIYDKEHLNNLITLQRKKIALWNKPEYTKSVIKQSISNAKTTEQLNNNTNDNTKVAEPLKNDPEIQRAIIDKQAEIEADNAAENIVQPGIGNQDLFVDDNQDINDIKEVNNLVHGGVDNNTHPIEESEQGVNTDSDIESRRADIEKRRKEELEKRFPRFTPENKAKYNALTEQIKNIKRDKNGTVIDKEKLNQLHKERGEIEQLPFMAGQPREEQRINEKYDKELEDLNNNNNSIENFVHQFNLEPKEFDFDKSPEEAKERVKKSVGNILSRLSPNASFEDLVRHIVRVGGEGTADELFNAIRYGWEANNKAPVDYEAVYQRVFGNPVDEFKDAASQLILSTPAEVATEINNTTNDILANSEKPEGVDDSGAPVYIYTNREGGQGYVTSEASPKFAYQSIPSIKILADNEANKIEVSHEYISDDLNQSEYIDSKQLLDYDKFREGTNIIIRVPENYNSIKIPVYDTDGSKKATMSFGQYIAENNLDSNSQEYKDKIPIIIYSGDSKLGDKGVAFVHDIGWYNYTNFNQASSEQMREAIANTRAIREEILNSRNMSTTGKVTNKRETTFNGLKTKEPITLREANPETMLSLASSDKFSAIIGKTGETFPNNNAVFINSKPFQYNGQILDIRRYGVDSNGKPTYVALPVLRSKLDEQAITSIIQAITIYANRNNLSQEQKNVVEHIKSTMGNDVDITASPTGAVATGLKAYLSHFIRIFEPNKSSTNKEVEDHAKAQLAYGTPYITFISGGNIVFGVAGVPAYVDSKDGHEVYSYFINPNTTKPSMALQRLNSPMNVVTKKDDKEVFVKMPMLQWYEHNLSKDRLAVNKPIVTIDKNNTTTVAAKTYNDYLLDHIKTNMRSINIGTEENPKWITNIQPIITYDTNKRLEKTVEQPDNKTIEKEINPELEKVVTKDTSVDDILKQALDRANKRLGNDKGIASKNNYEPREMTKAERLTISESIDRIAGLNFSQQFTITNFLFNQITSLVNFDNNIVDKNLIDKEVEKTFDEIVLPIRNEDKNEVKFLTDLLQNHPELNNSEIPDRIRDFQYRIDTIDTIKNQYSKLKDIAYKDVMKKTGITQNKQIVDIQDGENSLYNNSGDEDTTRETDFWTDILTESPENRLSYAMRRFFGQIRQYDENNKPKTGFLNLPLYEDSSNITRVLMQLLINVPADFKTMIDKLDTMKDGIPWMKDAIDRLNNTTRQRQNQFVTVMKNTSLRMKRSDLTYNRKSGNWEVKLRDEFTSGASGIIKKQWRNNLLGDSRFNLIQTDENGNHILNKVKAETLINRFNGWVGETTRSIDSSIAPIMPALSQVRLNTPVTVNLRNDTSGLLTELRTKLASKDSRARFTVKGTSYQITPTGIEGQYKIGFLDKAKYGNKEELENWLREFGIILSPRTLQELTTKGLFHNAAMRSPSELFEVGRSNGLFGILYSSLTNLMSMGEEYDITEYGNSPLDNSVITSLANLEAEHNNIQAPFGGRVNGNSYYTITTPSFITDRATDLKSNDDAIRNNLRQISFSSNSFILKLLDDPDFRDKYGVFDDSAESVRLDGKRASRKASLSNLSDMDHEISKLSKFQYKVGDVKYGPKKLNKFPDTTIPLRLATMFGLTMSDKDRMKLFQTAVLDLNSTYLKDGINDEVIKVLYDQTVKPELLRMSKHAQLGGRTDIAAYDNGARMFLMMPEINNVMINPNLRLVDAIKNKPFDFTVNYVENEPDIMKDIYNAIKATVNNLVDEKIKVWEDNNIIDRVTNKDGTTSINNIKFFDRNYMSKFSGNNEEKLRQAAADFEINTLIANANNFMLYAGDPALYYKSDSLDYIQQAEDTFNNINKRLANQIAPGFALANSINEKYLQIFINDRVATAHNIDKLESILGEKGAEAYRKIKIADAQEYTTWKEHLDILSRMGKNADFMFDITPKDIDDVRDMLERETPIHKLTEQQYQTLIKVMQPIKPVYTGQMYDKNQDVYRTVYIKSSSFPLIPQLTKGLEIDKLRDRMEKLQKNTKLNVRASYQTANKVGALNLDKAVKLWNDDGTIDENTLNNLSKYTLQLDRSNFRIQQEVPFKVDKTKADYITLGSQLIKLLFGDGMINEGGFEYNGKEYTGKELHEIYNNDFTSLVNEKRTQLYDTLGLDEKGVPIDVDTSIKKLQDLLLAEATKRGYPLQSIKGLELDTTTGMFKLPLWASINSDRYESMLNAIVSKRLIAMKFPGNSYITGSEEGFKTATKSEEDLTPAEKSNIIYTSNWNGDSLKPNQVFLPSRFRDNDGSLIDLLQTKDGEHIYVNKTDNGFELNESKFDPELLHNISFRIPTSGHQSANRIEIAGFTPYTSGDLIIVGRNTIVQKGLDFDIDKENVYKLWTYVDPKTNKIEVLSDKHRTAILAEVDKMKDSNDKAANKFFDELFGDEVPYSPEEINSDTRLKLANSKINEKILQNNIIRIHDAVYANNKKSVQSKITRVLSTKFAEDQANFIDSLENKANKTKFNPLSSEYQKKMLMAGASSTTGRGAYSLDVTFNSLVQQLHANNKTVDLNKIDFDEENNPIYTKINWRFGKGSIIADGILGKINTIDGDRTISEVLSEAQNMAVDNASLGNILGRLNLNTQTFDVHKVFNLLGLDKGRDGNSISFLFLSQPIIKDYVEMMNNANSIFAEFSQDNENKIVSKLLQKYDKDTKEEDIDDKYWEVMSDQMGNDNLISSLSSKTPDGKLQGAILRRFLEMKQYGLGIRAIQATINFSNNSLGKSIFNTIDRRNALNRLGYDTVVKDTNGNIIGNISGARELVGDYIHKDSGQEIKDGYIDIGNYFVKPTTIVGNQNIHSVNTAYNLWAKHFPYDTPVIQNIYNEILPIISNPNIVGGSRNIEYKQDIFKNIKKYLSANKMNGLINNNDDVNLERHRLYIDTKNNTSLAMYMKRLTEMTDNPIVNTYIKTNKLINRFEYDVKKDGTPSLIKYNNAQGEEFDEQYLYEALSSMLEPNGATGTIQLPTIGNKSYTLDRLAQDLIAYSYIGNATQEAIQFTKYIPVSYLNVIGYTDWLKNSGNLLDLRSGTSEDSRAGHLVSEFTMQFIQHFPDLVKYRDITYTNFKNKIIDSKYTKTKNNATTLDSLVSFNLKSADNPIFISIYNPFASKNNDKTKYQLYWFDGEKYTRIPVLGTFGMDEYQPGSNGYGKTIVNNRFNVDINPQKAINTAREDSGDIFDVNSKNLSNILSKISDAKLTGLSDLATAIAPYIKDDIKIEYTDNLGARGLYRRAENKIYIDRDNAATESSFIRARTILHETVHALTVNQISPYITQEADGRVSVHDNAPRYITELVRLYHGIRSRENTQELQNLLERVQNRESIDSSKGEYVKYGLTDLDEFIAMALTSSDFQKYLAKPEFKQSGETLLERFKNIIQSILSAIGVKFESNTATAHAINSIFQLIDESSKTNIDAEYKKMMNDSMNSDFDDMVNNKEESNTAKKSNFQGYKGGFENIGKGTPQGDGKDKAMREVADGFIGEIVKQDSSSATSKKEIENKVISAKGKMTFSYGDNKRDDVKSSTTFEAIKNGERVATTRYESDGHIDYWKNLKEGDVIEWENANKEKVLVKVTKPLHKLVGSGKTAEQWSKLEGWSVKYFNSKVKPKLNEAWQIEYKTLQNNIVMLARNSEFKGRPLKEETKQQILQAHNQGSKFVVGDMPNVDSQFIDYLNEIGAKYTIYHTGNESRIKVGNTNLEPFPTKNLNIKDEKCL